MHGHQGNKIRYGNPRCLQHALPHVIQYHLRGYAVVNLSRDTQGTTYSSTKSAQEQRSISYMYVYTLSQAVHAQCSVKAIGSKPSRDQSLFAQASPADYHPPLPKPLTPGRFAASSRTRSCTPSNRTALKSSGSSSMDPRLSIGLLDPVTTSGGDGGGSRG